MRKYLYGKSIYLNDWIKGKQGLRLSDIAHYSIMENARMRDNELAKEFVYDKDQIAITLNGVSLDSKTMGANPVMTVFPERCFCVCFSGKKDDLVLFERFEADVCIEVDVPSLVELLTAATSHLEGVTIIHNDVNYYPPVMASPPPDIMSALFYKRDIYAVENEYRIALTIPAHRKFFKSPSGESIAIFSDDPNDIRHMFVNGTDPKINTRYITSITYNS